MPWLYQGRAGAPPHALHAPACNQSKTNRAPAFYQTTPTTAPPQPHPLLLLPYPWISHHTNTLDSLRTRFLRRQGGGPRQGWDPVESLVVKHAAGGRVGEGAVEADEDGDGGQRGQAAWGGERGQQGVGA